MPQAKKDQSTVYWVLFLFFFGPLFFFGILSALTFINVYQQMVFWIAYLFLVLPIGTLLLIVNYVKKRKRKTKTD